jgi:hypothetical protein
MGDTPQNGSDRLDSWKAIAAYLNRDDRTVRRWERERGLPVRRVRGGRGTSVFAYASEIDAWLNASGEERPVPSETPLSTPLATKSSRRWRVAAIVALCLVALATMTWRYREASAAAGNLRIEMTPEAIVAYDASGAQRWRYVFQPSYRVWLPDLMAEPGRMLPAPNASVYAATSHRVRRSDELGEGGELLSLSVDGKLLRSFSFTDAVTFDRVKYGPPWAITAFEVDDSGSSRRTAVAAHHFQWSASLVTILDQDFQRHGTYVQSGWIEAVHWLAPNRLLIGGFNHARDGGMVALLDPSALDGQAPESPGTHDYCESCGARLPLRMIVLPRTEVNRVTGSRFNRAKIQVMPDRIVARTIEVEQTSQEAAADVLYEFSPSLDLIRASFSARYWELHRALEQQGKLTHSRETCPDRNGPREMLMWEPATGWRRTTISTTQPSRR